jgi:hypothetical protein
MKFIFTSSELEVDFSDNPYCLSGRPLADAEGGFG